MDFPSLLAVWCGRAGIDETGRQAALAHALNDWWAERGDDRTITRGAVHHWFHGRSTPDKHQVPALVAVLRLSSVEELSLYRLSSGEAA